MFTFASKSMGIIFACFKKVICEEMEKHVESCDGISFAVVSPDSAHSNNYCSMVLVLELHEIVYM